ncbi:MAG: hypothetical protein HYV29_00750 [Ignavibacteriales bacterium]|nr:hypothetical protein [Ignavibacteriales bacterium]
MKPSLQNTILAGVAGTVLMTVVMFLAPMMGLPEMNAAAMLSMVTGFPIVIGWLMHFMIGVIFALGYTFLFITNVKIQNLFVKGATFGFAVFIFAQIAIAMMGAIMGGMPAPEDGMILMMIGSIIGHVMYGIPVALIAKPQQ